MHLTSAANNILDKSNWENFIDKILGFMPTLLFAFIIFVLGIFATKIILKILSRGLRKSKLDVTAHGFLKSLVRIVLYTLVIVISLTILKVPMTSIVAVIGAAGLAVGLALQNSLSNLAGGFIILFSKPFSVGDFIESNGVSGAVESISILYTRLLTPDNKVVYIPNGQVSGSKIVNYTQEKMRRLDLNFEIAYTSDYNEAIRVLKDVIANNSLALTEPEPFVRVGEQSAKNIVITMRVWVESENYMNLNHDLLEQVKTAFDENNIAVPYNQIDVHLDK